MRIVVADAGSTDNTLEIVSSLCTSINIRTDSKVPHQEVADEGWRKSSRYILTSISSGSGRAAACNAGAAYDRYDDEVLLFVHGEFIY